MYQAQCIGGPLPPPPGLPVPALAAAWGLTRNVIYSTFQDSSQIDMAGTLDPIKVWYRKNKWTGNPNAGSVWTTVADTPTSSIVTGASGLVLSNGADSGVVGLSSAAETTPGSYVGTVVIGSRYVGCNNANNNVELNYQTFIDTALHHWEYLHIVPSDNGGTGKIRVYLDGILRQDISYSATTGSTPAASPSNPNGVFTVGDSMHMLLKIGAGSNTPITCPLVEMWSR